MCIRDRLISPEVIAKYAGETAYECFGIVGMAMVSVKDGRVRLLKKEMCIRDRVNPDFISVTYGAGGVGVANATTVDVSKRQF